MIDTTVLLACDLDGTLLGDPDALGRFCRWYARFGDQRQIVYASGRFVASVLEDMKKFDLPPPVAIVGGLGTQVRMFPTLAAIPEWERDLALHWNHVLVRNKLASVKRLVLQPSVFQSSEKVSYYIPNATTDELKQIQGLACHAAVAADVIYSSNRDLDIIPAGINKGSAVAYLAWLFGFPKERVIVCGDSANDLAMFQRRFRGVTVGNAHPELKRLDGPDVFHSSRPFADGVLEGVQHWLQFPAEKRGGQGGSFAAAAAAPAASRMAP